jgi:hypothetical protein
MHLPTSQLGICAFCLQHAHEMTARFCPNCGRDRRALRRCERCGIRIRAAYVAYRSCLCEPCVQVVIRSLHAVEMARQMSQELARKPEPFPTTIVDQVYGSVSQRAVAEKIAWAQVLRELELSSRRDLEVCR